MTTIPDDATAGNRWAAALLLTLAGFEGEEEWVDLTEAHDLATEVAKGQFTTNCTYSTQRNMKRDLCRQELIEQRRVGKSFEVRITQTGREAAKRIEDNPSWGQAPASTSELPLETMLFSRVGIGHFLPRVSFALLMKKVNAGEVDLIVIPHDKPTKIKYWDEAH